MVARLEELCATSTAMGRTSGGGGIVGEDPALDQFMEAYCEMLTKYEQELSKPFKEAMVFLSRIECQFKALTLAANSSHESGDTTTTTIKLPSLLSFLKMGDVYSFQIPTVYLSSFTAFHQLYMFVIQ